MQIITNRIEFDEYLSRVSKDESVCKISEITCTDFSVELSNRNKPHVIEGCHFGNLLIENFHGGWIRFKDCKIALLDILKASGVEGIAVQNCEIYEFNIYSANSETLSIDLANNEIQKFHIDGTVNDIEIFEGKFKKIRIERLNANRLLISQIVLEDTCFIKESKLLLNTSIQKCENAKFTISDSEFGSLSFDSCKGLLTGLTKCKLGAGNFMDSTFLDFLIEECNGGVIDSLDCLYEKFQIYGTSDLSLNIRRAPHKPNHLQLYDVNFFESVGCREIQLKILEQKINSIQILESRFEKVFEISNCSIKQELVVSHSNLGKLAFNSIQVEESCRITLTNSNLIDVSFSSFRWNSNYMLFEHGGITNYHTSVSLRETYRQLKANYVKNNNKIEALEFQKHELRIHYNILNATKWSSFRDFGNFLIVGSNKWFSDFGQNIWKPLLFLFGVHLVLFNGLLFFNSDLGYHITWPKDWDWDATKSAAGLYFETILPTHTTKVKGFFGNDVSIGGFLDFAIRIFSGYFIFYFISASRKYHQ